MREGIVLVLDEREMINTEGDTMAFYTKSNVYRADLVICGDKILKNKWGRHGTIVEPYYDAVQQEECYKILLEIFDEIVTKKEKEIWKSYPKCLIKELGSLF